MLKDIELYNHFNRTLWKRVDEYGRERMAKDLKKLRTFRKKRSNAVEIDAQAYRKPSKNQDFEVIKKIQDASIQYMKENSGGCYLPGMEKAT